MDTLKILQDNADKPFVQRVLNPSKAPLKIKGKKVTHAMSAEIDPEDGVAYVFPTVVVDDEGNYKQFNDPFAALDYNKRRGNVIGFATMQEALKFSKNYKTQAFKDYYK